MITDNLKFYNGYGGFDANEGEYVILKKTPLPWINCISSVKGEPFGFIISEAGGGYVWQTNSRENPITQWYCDPFEDLSDEKTTLTIFESNTERKLSMYSDCIVRHGFGYSSFQKSIKELWWNITTFVPPGVPVKIAFSEVQANLDTEISLSYTVTSKYQHCAWMSPCANRIKLKKGEKYEFVTLLAKNDHAFLDYKDMRCCKEALKEVKKYWQEYLSTIKIQTPDESINMLMSGWLQYQAVSCRINGRTAFYQCGGAYGFRDQLQDCMAILYTDPKKVKERILAHASRQYEEGDVQHWWHPPHNAGIRSRYSDDLLWLVYITSKYIEATGDTDILKIEVPFIKSKPLDYNETDRYETPEVSDKKDTLFNHCLLACRYAQKYGEHHIPLIKGGDWNDGMNRVGIKGKGESVWLGWFLCYCLKEISKMALMIEKTFVDRNKIINEANQIAEAIEKNAWDGSWYIRAFCDNGKVLGSSRSAECMIDSIAQSWAVLSGFGHNTRSKKALLSAERFLADYENGIIKLLTPPFSENSIEDVGYIASYPAGIRENGAQYTHAAVWLGKAFLKIAKKLDGCEEFSQKGIKIINTINPVNHTRTLLEAARYKTEPYVMAADVYSQTNVGRGGWSWYTGSAAWMYNVILEDIIGFSVKNYNTNKAEAIIAPCFLKEWKAYTVEYKYKSAKYIINITSKAKYPQTIKLSDDGKKHEITLK